MKRFGIVISLCATLFQLTMPSRIVNIGKGKYKPMGWLNNGWVVGIATSVISGLLVTWIARILLSKKEDREYRQKIAAANRDIIYAVRGGVAEGKLSERDVVLALTEATARRYDVSSGDLYVPKEIAQELIKEVMDSSFLPTEKKLEYCGKLVEFGKEPTVSPETLREEEMQRSLSRRKRAIEISWIFGAIAGVASLVGVLLQWKELRIGEHLLSFAKGVGWFFLAVIVLALLVNFLGAATEALRRASLSKGIERKDKSTG